MDINTNNKITSLKEHLLYLDKTDDKHFIDKIVELYEDGVDEETLQSIFGQRSLVSTKNCGRLYKV